MNGQAFSAEVITTTVRTMLAVRAVAEYRIVTTAGAVTVRRAGELRWNDDLQRAEVYVSGEWVLVPDAGIAGMAHEERLHWLRPNGTVLRWDDAGTEGRAIVTELHSNPAAPFVLTEDTPESRAWEWNGYTIEWEPLPEDDSWDEEWQYVLINGDPSRSGGCSFRTLEEAVKYAVADDENLTYLIERGRAGQSWEAFKKGLDALAATGAPLPFEWAFAAYNSTALAAFNAKWSSSLKLTCNACPVQIHGQLADGTWLYFYERYGDWEICVGPTEDEAVFGTELSSGDHSGIPGGMSIFQVLSEVDAALEARAGGQS